MTLIELLDVAEFLSDPVRIYAGEELISPLCWLGFLGILRHFLDFVALEAPMMTPLKYSNLSLALNICPKTEAIMTPVECRELDSCPLFEKRQTTQV